MRYSPSLPPEILDRAFHAFNGELGIQPSDAIAFLHACEADQVGVRGWELWIVDYKTDPVSGNLVASRGDWSSLVPKRQFTTAVVVRGQGDIFQTMEQMHYLDLDDLVDPKWTGLVRINFRLD